jgi:hypothetical protein
MSIKVVRDDDFSLEVKTHFEDMAAESAYASYSSPSNLLLCKLKV